MKKSFASDNWSGACPEIMEALQKANTGHVEAYGEAGDPYTQAAIRKFKTLLGESVSVFFVYNGTAANVLGVKHLIRSYQAIVAAKSAHLNEDECGAPEKFSGSKILEIETDDGLIKPDQIVPFLSSIGFQHHVQPRIITISQVTEKGTLYQPHEVKALADFAHQHQMFLHMDGSRVSNAAVALGADIRSFTTDAGVDVMSFGGTKNGMMFGEAVVFFNPELAKDFEYTRKQGMQLHSKMRFIAAQFDRFLTDDLWKKNATHANRMAQLLAKRISGFKKLRITREVMANGVFVELPPEAIPEIQKEYYFHIWDETTHEVRLMCSWDTTEADIEGFTACLSKVLKE